MRLIIMNNIWYLTIFILLTVYLYFWLKKMLYKSLFKEKNNYRRLEYEHNNIFQENTKLKRDNLDLEKTVDQTIALYDISRDIYKHLDPDEVFTSFRGQINKYVRIDDCQFLKSDADLSGYTNYTTLPLKIDESLIGYLLTCGNKEEDKDKFNILVQQFLLGLKRAILYQRVQELAITDSLTQVFTRRYCLERLDEEIERSKKFKYSFSFLMIDLDYFKEYNDRYGHLVGDAILKEVAKTIKETIRQIDLMARFGGEEFLIILTETDKEKAKFAAERIRKAAEDQHTRVYDEDLKVTISIGISTFPDDGKDVQALIDKADSLLYQAKQAGRNRICA